MAFYRILCDGYPLMDTRLDEYSVYNPTCTVELNKTGSLSFDIDPTHPYYEMIHKVSSVITLLENDQIIFRGRVMDDDIPFDKVKTVECEGELSFLLDSIVRPYTFSGSVSDLVKLYLDSHNEQVEARKQFKLGNVTVTDPNNYIVRASSDYPNTWNEFNDKTIELLGGYLRLRYTQDGTYFDYVESYENVNQQVIDFGENLLDLSKYVKAADVATRIIPLGAQVETEGESEEGTEKRLTIKGVNGGKDYVEDAEAIDLYGVISKVVTYDDVTTETALLSKGYEALAAQKLLQITLEVTALDLHVMNVDIERIKIGDMIKVRSKPHGIDEYMLVSKIQMDLDDPSKTVITLGSTFATFTNETKGANTVLADVANIKSDYASTAVVQAAMNEISNTVQTQIVQSSIDIVTLVSSDHATKTDLESLNEELSSQIQQTDEDVQLTFERTTLYTDSLAEEMRSVYEQILTYYRFDENGAIIGKSDSPFETRVDNEELGFYQNGQRVAYISNNKLYNTDVEVNNALTIGNYENGYWDWLPRQNGNLSLKWRGGAN